jgi:hypothetical protein
MTEFDHDGNYKRDFAVDGISMTACVCQDQSTFLLVHEDEGYAISSGPFDFEAMVMVGVAELVDEGAPVRLLDLRARIIAEFDQLLSEYSADSELIQRSIDRNEWAEGVRDGLIFVAIVATIAALVNWFLK